MPLGDAYEVGRTAGPEGERIAWLDTETTGLAGGTGTYVFLIGLAAVDDGQVTLTQHFLQHLSAEAEMLESLRDHLRQYDALVTFNGTRFDLPLLQTRFLLNRLRADLETQSHLDLMTLARRLWYRRLGGYSLALLEQAILRVERFIDVPGWMVPSLYVQYLNCGDLDLLEPVFEHNAQDVLSLVALHGVAGELLAFPDRPRIAVDWFGLGRLLETRENREAAAGCYRVALKEERDPAVRRRAATALARYYRRSGRINELLALWDREAQAGILPQWLALERLAMLSEWQMCDTQRALALTDEALACLNGANDSCQLRLLHRRDRLLRKMPDSPSVIGRSPSTALRAGSATKQSQPVRKHASPDTSVHAERRILIPQQHHVRLHPVRPPRDTYEKAEHPSRELGREQNRKPGDDPDHDRREIKEE